MTSFSFLDNIEKIKKHLSKVSNTFKNIMKNDPFASNAPFFHNFSKYIVFQRRQRELSWSKVLNLSILRICNRTSSLSSTTSYKHKYHTDDKHQNHTRTPNNSSAAKVLLLLAHQQHIMAIRYLCEKRKRVLWQEHAG